MTRTDPHPSIVWLASYPRSGNTFFRNILFHVYGIESLTYHLQNKDELDRSALEKRTFVKTHLTPDQIPILEGDQVIYLVRDGRDSVLSRAHRKKNMVDRFSNFKVNLINFISSQYPGGSWSGHVSSWAKYATVTVKFEELIKDPIGQTKRIEECMPMPSPDWAQMPTFESQKQGNARYVTGNSTVFFRKGKIGSWKEEIPSRYILLFNKLHGNTLFELNYTERPNHFSRLDQLIIYSTFIEVKFFQYLNLYYRFINKILSLKGNNK